MDLLCKTCDKDFIQNQSKYDHYIATLPKEYDRSIYENYIIIIPKLFEVDKILKEFIISRNNKFNIYVYFINCEFFLVFDNFLEIHIETKYFYKKDDIT